MPIYLSGDFPKPPGTNFTEQQPESGAHTHLRDNEMQYRDI
jgi:hypothetical protein